MSLTWKDLVATVLVLLTGVVTYGSLKGFDWPLTGSWRTGSLALLIIGLGTCIIVGTGTVPNKDAWTMTATVLGVFGVAIGTRRNHFGKQDRFLNAFR